MIAKLLGPRSLLTKIERERETWQVMVYAHDDFSLLSGEHEAFQLVRKSPGQGQVALERLGRRATGDIDPSS
jgi:hypothetical protein